MPCPPARASRQLGKCSIAFDYFSSLQILYEEVQMQPESRLSVTLPLDAQGESPDPKLQFGHHNNFFQFWVTRSGLAHCPHHPPPTTHHLPTTHHGMMENQ